VKQAGQALAACPVLFGRDYFFQGTLLPGMTGATGLGGCLGFFFSRLLFCWPLGMALLLKGRV
jgi:hypothetical protein